ncbi:polysaccharide deacetylase family protein [Psychromonas sp. B3M02]|nr:polysaccharide deacetylase family protein [Psychromonas sp. B3M02]
MVHGVMGPDTKTVWSPLRKQLSVKEFDRTLKMLSQHYNFITVQQSIDILSDKIPPIDNALLITFDDGYRNNIDYALPICEKYDIKPVIFVVTNHVNSGLPFWFDRLDYALQQNMGQVLSLTHKDDVYTFDATSRDALVDSYKKFRDICKGKFSDDIELNYLFDSLCDTLEERSGSALKDICHEDDWSAVVSWEILKKLTSDNRIDVASHTQDHLRLDCLIESKILSQLKQSKVCIEKELAVKCDYFCYPNGNYNKLSKQLVKEVGYQAAFSTDVGLCQSKDDLMTLKRFNFPAHKKIPELLFLLNTK